MASMNNPKDFEKMDLFRSDFIGDYYRDADGTIYKHRHKDGIIHIWLEAHNCWAIADHPKNPPEFRFH